MTPVRAPHFVGLALAVVSLAAVPSLFCQEKVPNESAVDRREAEWIRVILKVGNYGKYVGELEDRGSAVNDVYLEVLKDKNAGSLEITRALNMVARQNGDRKAFLPVALELLAHKEDGVRWNAAILLGKIGGPEHAAKLVPLLTDESHSAQSEAAAALANIGTAKELEAMDRRLATKLPGDYEEILADLRESRDKFKQRLERQKKKKD